MSNVKVEIHLLQNFPPSCLNRDDTNTPKTCEFGGFNRARVSSQCWKRAIREQFRASAPERTGTRSKRLKAEILEAFTEESPASAELQALVEKFITSYIAGMDKKRTDETNVLVFYSQQELDEMVAILNDEEAIAGLKLDPPQKNNAVAKRLKAAGLSPDIALFARMLADNPDLNVDAACQVAHAISTHAVNVEWDFYTAVDDLKDTNANDDAGAGMLGTVGYDSACYYRYAAVDMKQLVANLGGSRQDAEKALSAFLTAFCEAVPEARKNSFANGNPPFLAYLVVRRSGAPASLVNAFARPVKAEIRGQDLLTESALALAAQADKFDTKYELYRDADCYFFHALDSEITMPGTEKHKLREVISAVVTAATGVEAVA